MTRPAVFSLSGRAPGRGPATWRRIADLLALWAQRRRSREALARLDPRLLRDIGLDAGSAAQEADRPFWR